MNIFKVLKIIPVFLLVMLVLAACSSSAPVAPPAEAVGEATPVTDPASSQPVGEASPTEASADPAAPVQDVKPTPRPDLHASDPSTVSLASGQLQLVEFFAFW